MSKPQAVLDALADAETLRSVTWPSLLGLDGTPSPYEPYAVIPHGEESYWRARYAARAAFRAVPELRG